MLLPVSVVIICLWFGQAAVADPSLRSVSDWTWTFATQPSVLSDSCATDAAFANASPVYEVVPGVRLAFKRLPANCSADPRHGEDYVYITMWQDRAKGLAAASVGFSELRMSGPVFSCKRETPLSCFDSQGFEYIVRESDAGERAARNLTTIETGTNAGTGGEVYDRATMRVRAGALDLPLESATGGPLPGGRAYADKRIIFARNGGFDDAKQAPKPHPTSLRENIAVLYLYPDSGVVEERPVGRKYRNLAWIIIGATSGGLILLLGLFVTIVRPQGEGCGLWLRATSSGPLTWCVPLSSLPAVLFLGLMLAYLAIMIGLSSRDFVEHKRSSPIFRGFGEAAIMLFAFLFIPTLKHVNIIATRVFGAPFERLVKMHVVIGGLLFVVLSVHFGGMWRDVWSYKNGVYIVNANSPRRNLFGLLAFITLVLAMVLPAMFRHRVSAVRFYSIFKALHLLYIVVFAFGCVHNIYLLYATLPGLVLFVLDRVVVHAVTRGGKTIATAEGLRPGGDAVDDCNDTRTLVVGATLDEGAGVATVRLSMRREVLATTALQWLSPLCCCGCAKGEARICLFRDLPPAQYMHLGAKNKIPMSHPFTIANIAPAFLSKTSGAVTEAPLALPARDASVGSDATPPTTTGAAPVASSDAAARPVDPLRAVAVFHIKNMGNRTFTASLADKIRAVGGASGGVDIPLKDVAGAELGAVPPPEVLAALMEELQVTYGAPAGLLQVNPASVETAVLVCGGIGVTPMCSLLEHLGRRAVAAAAEGGDEGARAHLREHCGCDRCANGQWELGAATQGGLGLLRDVHVVWVNRGAGPAGLLEGSLLQHAALLERFSGVRVHLHLFDTQHKGPGGAIAGRAETVQGGRPDLAKIMDAALGGRDAPRVGVFSCGPAPLMATARLEAGRRGLLLHEETFHF